MDNLEGTREVSGKQDRTNGQPASHQGGTRKAGKDHVDNQAGKELGRHQRGTREAG